MSRPETERYRLYRILKDGVTAYDYLQAPEIIPPDVKEIGFAGKVYPVFHGRERICSGLCTCGNCVRHTRDIEFEGLQPDVYLDSRTLAFIEVKTYIDHLMARKNTKVYENLDVKLPYSYAEFTWDDRIKGIAFQRDTPDIRYYDPQTGKLKTRWISQPKESDSDEEQYQIYAEKMNKRFGIEPLLGVVDSFTAVMKAMGISQQRINQTKADLTAYIMNLKKKWRNE